ncbi:MAG TPA: S26 family signal peptidase [Spirochaetota bacterium]|nr:S26 family signal peptidase [Spirochaetota bacterium]
MTKKIITSSINKRSKPLKAAILSLLLIGLGETYTGSPFIGASLLLLRSFILLSAAFYSYLNPHVNAKYAVIISLLLTIFVSFISPAIAYIKAREIKVLKWYNSYIFYLSFAAISLITTFTAAVIYFSFFYFYKADIDYPPLIAKGDILLIQKYCPLYTYGDLILIPSEPYAIIGRIIGLPGETVEYSSGRFIVNESHLHLSVFSEEDLKNFSLTDYDIYAEKNSNIYYPVIKNSNFKLNKTKCSPQEYFLAPDNRNLTHLFIKATKNKFNGKILGTIYSARGFVLFKNFSITEKD